MTTPSVPESGEAGLSSGMRLILILGGLVFLAACLFLSIPPNVLGTPAWAPAVQTELRAMLLVLSPYLGVALLGATVAMAELASTFPTYPREALRTRWSRILILVNVVAAILALIIARVTMPEANPVLLVIGVGVGFQSIIRTKFVLARSIGGPGERENEVSLNLGWLYEQFQNLCRTQIDLELMKNRRTAVIHLLEIYPTIAQLYDIAYYTIIARATLTPEEEKMRLEQLQTLIDPKAPEYFARNSMALTILENGGPGYVEMLLSQAQMESATAVPVRVSEEQLVWQLVENHTLAQLVALSQKICEDERAYQWVQDAAAPSTGTSEASQKASIAYFLVQQVGIEKVSQALAAPEAA